jgi:hypothetical protein
VLETGREKFRLSRSRCVFKGFNYYVSSTIILLCGERLGTSMCQVCASAAAWNVLETGREKFRLSRSRCVIFWVSYYIMV